MQKYRLIDNAIAKRFAGAVSVIHDTVAIFLGFAHS
jgi:hypothetical protein